MLLIIKSEKECDFREFFSLYTNEMSLQNIQAVKAKGVALVDSLSTYSNLWHSSRSIAKQHLVTAPGDALVTAAAVCYLGPLVPAARDELFADWLRVCDGASREPDERVLSLSSMMLEDSRNKTKCIDRSETGNGRRGWCKKDITVNPLLSDRKALSNVTLFQWKRCGKESRHLMKTTINVFLF